MAEGLRELTAQLSSLQEDVTTLITRTEALEREIQEDIIPRTDVMWIAATEDPHVTRRQQLSPRAHNTRNLLPVQGDQRRLSAQYQGDHSTSTSRSGPSSARLSRKWSSMQSLGPMGKRALSASSLSIHVMNEVTDRPFLYFLNNFSY